MSLDQARAFLTKLTEDEEAATRADDAYVESLLRLSREMEYDISEAELRRALFEYIGPNQLSEEQLEKVAGGLGLTDLRGETDSVTQPGSLLGIFPSRNLRKS